MAGSTVGSFDVCAIGTALVLLLALFRHSKERAKSPLPPGPRKYPVIGNVLQMPQARLWEKAFEWSKFYGDLVYVENVGVPMLIVNSYDVAMDLLNKRSAIYSSRPQLIMTCELSGWGWVTTTVPYGETHRKHRSYLHRFFQSPDVLNYKEIQQRETYTFVKGLLDSPQDYEKHVRRLPGAVVLMNVYGHKVEDEDDHLVRLGEAGIRVGAESVQYFFLEFMPWLKHLPEWFPGVSFHRMARYARGLSDAFRNTAYSTTKQLHKIGEAKECMATILLNENTLEDGTIRNEREFADAAATAFLGASDTSATTIMTFFLAMLKYPEVQRKGQEEIDRVVGHHLPTFEDRDQLPYINAICSELLRWEVILPLAFPHTTTADDEYRGYRIPKGTSVFVNSWAISQDPNIYEDPLAFKPERWLETGSRKQKIRAEDFAFGFGRRICPGQNWAEHIVFIAVASVLAAFTLEKEVGSDGKEIPPNDEYHSGFLRSLAPSKCKITPRSETMAALIQESVHANL